MSSVRLLVGLLLLGIAGFAQAHPLAPGLYELRETRHGEFAVTWKLPLQLPNAEWVAPVHPPGCEARSRGRAQVEGSGMVVRYPLHCAGPLAAGTPLAVTGLERTGASILLRVHTLEGHLHRAMLSAANTGFTLPAAASGWVVLHSHLVLGVQHILSGADHLLFVLALVLLAPRWRQLVWVITAFTLGHSVTLALAALGHLRLPAAPVEALIALSVALVAARVVDVARGAVVRLRFSAPLCIAFGLLHGLGFAGALREAGLPATEVPLGLLGFNLGIELGQLAFVALVLLLRRLSKPWLAELPGLLRQAPGYAIGCIAGFWFFERLILI